jgi:hypothetical protein
MQEAAAFFKRRSAIEGDYGRDMLKLARTSVDAYSMNDGKAGCVARSGFGRVLTGLMP